MTIVDMPSNFYFVGASSPEALRVREFLNMLDDNQTSFFVAKSKGYVVGTSRPEYDTIYGMRGFVPHDDKEVYPLYPFRYYEVSIFSLKFFAKVKSGSSSQAIDKVLSGLHKRGFDFQTAFRTEAIEVHVKNDAERSEFEVYL
jgi:hypothetical protein